MKPAPGDIRGEMGLNNESVLHLRRVRERDGLKFGLYTSWTAGVTMPSDSSIFETTPRLSFSERTDLSSLTLLKLLQRSWQRIHRQRARRRCRQSVTQFDATLLSAAGRGGEGINGLDGSALQSGPFPVFDGAKARLNP